jgi:transposase
MAEATVDLWALDEVHFQQHGSRCRMWVPPETKDPVLQHHPTRHSVGYFVAVRLRDGSFRFRREREKFNGLTFFEFMKELYQTSLTRGCCVVVITDHAKYHHARLHRQWREEHAPEFELDYLPPYSPELNPIERVWKLIRRLCLHNRCFPLLQEVMTTVEAEFVGWANPNEPSDDYAQLLKTLCLETRPRFHARREEVCGRCRYRWSRR